MLPRDASKREVISVKSVGLTPNHALMTMKRTRKSNGWTRDGMIGIAVKYYDAYNVPETEKIKALRAANTQAYCKYKELASAFHFANAKAEYIGCKNCGSKIARKYLRRNFCPVCNADLRPETTLNRIAALKEKADKSSDTLKAELTKQAMKAKNVRWKIKIEFHE